jgi:hypothetical protein
MAAKRAEKQQLAQTLQEVRQLGTAHHAAFT